MDDTQRQQTNDNYLIDVAAERVYVSQNKSYHDAFTRWRNDANNRYGYRFVHDSREHTYVDGEGYADNRSENAERSSLRQCFSFLGMSMLMLFLFGQIQFMIMRTLFNEKTVEWTYYSELHSQPMVTLKEMAVSCGFRIFSLLVILLMYVFFIHLPVRVSFPSSKLDPRLVTYSIIAALIMTVVFHLFDLIVSDIADYAGLDITYYSLKPTSSNVCFTLYIICEMLVIPIMMELLFRGCILQLFRQFGDRFAILVSSCAAACCYHDITKTMYVLCLSILLGIVTIKTGSIIPAIIVKITSSAFTVMINTILTDENTMYASLLESIICLSLLVSCTVLLFVLRIKMIRPFKLGPDRTALPLAQKSREVLNSLWPVLWLSVTLITIILSFELK